jgi:hypothetical protein
MTLSFLVAAWKVSAAATRRDGHPGGAGRVSGRGHRSPRLSQGGSLAETPCRASEAVQGDDPRPGKGSPIGTKSVRPAHGSTHGGPTLPTGP